MKGNTRNRFKPTPAMRLLSGHVGMDGDAGG